MKKQTLILLNLVFLAFNIQAQDSISCDCISTNELFPDRKITSHHMISSEELLKVPHDSETYVTDVSDYTLEKDNQGRVFKLICSHQQDQSTEEISYTYDSQNRLISKDIHFEKNTSGGYTYRDEKILFYYDANGRLIRKVLQVPNGTGESFILEECNYTYQ